MKEIKEINPFICEQQIEVFSYKKTETLGNPDIDGINRITTINTSKLMDRSNKVNIYMTPELRQIYMLLTETSHKLLRYIEGILQYNQDVIKINVDKFMKEGLIKSKATVYKAIEELCRYGFITKYHKQTYYWINPLRFFNGNRIVKYPENLVIKE